MVQVKSDPDGQQRPGAKAIEEVLEADPKSVVFLPVYGEAHSEPLCFLLRVEGLVFLLDCGWTEGCDVSLIEPLAAIAPHVDVVLISHSDIAHVGALPYAVAKLGLTAPIYATLPVIKMGEMYLYDLLVSLEEVSDVEAMTLDDVDAAFERVIGVRYAQQVVLSSAAKATQGRETAATQRLVDVRVTAHPSGHTLGGAIWTISVQQQDFIYAVHMNLKNDGHLSSCRVQTQFDRPALLITDATCQGRADKPVHEESRFLDAIMHTLRHTKGNILVPVDTASRALEVILTLEAHWKKNRLIYPLVFLSKMASTVIQFAASQLEFLSEKLQKGFTDGTADNPFKLRHVIMCDSLEGLRRLPQQHNMVVLVSSCSLDACMSQLLLRQWGEDPRNVVMLVQEAPPGSLAHVLRGHAASGGHAERAFELTVGRRVPLSPEELAAKEAKDAADSIAKAEADAAVAMDAEDTPVGDDLAGLAGQRENTSNVQQRYTLSVKSQSLAIPEQEAPETGSAFAGVLIDGFVVPKGAAAPMFPDPPPPEECDEFGVVTDLHEMCARHYYGDDDDTEASAEPVPTTGTRDIVPILALPPSKVVYERVQLVVRARVLVFDFDGLLSQSSFLSMIKAIAPRNLVLIQRLPAIEAVLLPKVTVALSGLHTHTHLPQLPESVTLASTACYTARLSPDLNMTIEATELKNRSNYFLGWFDAVVGQSDTVSHQPLLEAPSASIADVHTPASVFLSHMMVSDVTKRLKDQNMSVIQEAECAIIDGGKVIVRQEDKQSRSELVIEGALTPLYYKVREIVYGQYRLVP